jgi:hypothetical protein
MRNVFQKELFIFYSLQQRHPYIIHDSSSQFGLTKEDTTLNTELLTQIRAAIKKDVDMKLGVIYNSPGDQ